MRIKKYQSDLMENKYHDQSYLKMDQCQKCDVMMLIKMKLFLFRNIPSQYMFLFELM